MKIKGKKTLTLFDGLDMQIIHELQIDGRQSNLQISKKLNTSEGTIRNRCRKLLNRDLIKVIAVLNPKTAGLNFACIIGLEVSLDKQDDVAQALSQSPHICFLSHGTAQFDLAALALFADLPAFETFMKTKVQILPGVEKTEIFAMWSIKKISFVADANMLELL